MSTIEEKLNAILDTPERLLAIALDASGHSNSAVAAYNLIILYFDKIEPSDGNSGWWGCRYCRGEKYYKPDRHSPSKCPVAAAQATFIALMEDANEYN